jgi:hypothetical protein
VWLAIAVAIVGVFGTWLSADPVTLNGVQGPNNGWLVVLVAVLAFHWARSMARGAWVGVVGLIGSAVVIGWTAVENWRDGRDVLDASASYGLVLVFVASLVLGGAAVVRGMELWRARERAGG